MKALSQRIEFAMKRNGPQAASTANGPKHSEPAEEVSTMPVKALIPTPSRFSNTYSTLERC